MKPIQVTYNSDVMDLILYAATLLRADRRLAGWHGIWSYASEVCRPDERPQDVVRGLAFIVGYASAKVEGSCSTMPAAYGRGWTNFDNSSGRCAMEIYSLAMMLHASWEYSGNGVQYVTRETVEKCIRSASAAAAKYYGDDRK